MSAAQPAPFPPTGRMRPGAVPERRVVQVRGLGHGRTIRRSGLKPHAARRVFLTRAGRDRVISGFWIGCVLSLWAVLLIYAGRDGIKPQDPSAAANIIRK